MDLNRLTKNREFILLECISGSRGYGLALPHSDTDIKGVFVLPKEEFYGLSYTEQVNNETNDIIFYELKKFIDLLAKNNPNILELLATPEDCVLYKHPLLSKLKPELFLSKLCQQTFAGYAQAQIKKARGLNKKISKPMEKERKSILDFCYVIKGQGSAPLRTWLLDNSYHQQDCGLVNIPHMKDMYAVFHRIQDLSGQFKGIASGDTANDVQLSSVPKGLQPLAIMSFNKDGYSVYCKEYREYWEWTEKRNEHRYQNTIEHGKNYDSKNMMHVFRLLNMAEEIAKFREIRVRRPEREFLLKIRSGDFLYEDLVKMAEEKTDRISDLFKISDLPDEPEVDEIEKLLIDLRGSLYG